MLPAWLQIGFWHFAHSYVRGNWRNDETSSSALLAKSCHDIDLIKFWVGDLKCEAVSSFGSLKHFRKENKVGGYQYMLRVNSKIVTYLVTLLRVIIV